MSRHIQISFSGITQQQNELLLAHLSEAGFDGFEEEEGSLKAFITEPAWNEAELQEIALRMGLNYAKDTLEETNWNQLWESNFEPVIVDDFVAVRADFHQPVPNVELEIIITPKMSFGTGHHSTTWLVMRQMKKLDLMGKSIFDFGTGTGILAILAEKLGAASVLAIDNDEWSIKNAAENIQRNGCNKVEIKFAGMPGNDQHFDIILANINKNVILEHIDTLSKQISAGGCLVLSGLLAEDEKDVLAKAVMLGLRLISRKERDNWLLLRLAP